MFREGCIELHYKYVPSMIEKTVDAFNNLLLCQIQVDKSCPSSHFYSL